MSERSEVLSSDKTMQRIAMHHIYEYEKGIRSMVLCTLSAEDLSTIVPKLSKRNISYYAKYTPSGQNVNLFFGRDVCIELTKKFLSSRDLHELTDEEDFMLGAMLGYDLCGQCARYLSRQKEERALG